MRKAILQLKVELDDDLIADMTDDEIKTELESYSPGNLRHSIIFDAEKFKVIKLEEV